MSYSLSFHIPKALPSLSPSHQHKISSLIISNQIKESHQYSNSKKKLQLAFSSINSITVEDSKSKISGLAIQVGALLATVAEPAFAVTGVNDEEDLVWVLIQLGIAAFIYFLIFPPIIMNWLRTRWYKRNLLEMYLQFMFVFMFFPGVLLWAPFLNFRKFPRDPDMKYPWSVPENPSAIKGGFKKYPWAQPEDYEY